MIGIGVNIGLRTRLSGAPSLDLNFAGTGILDGRITFTRASPATRCNSARLLVTMADNEPRFQYSPATGAAIGLLVEEQRTNLLTYSEDFNNAGWTKTGVDASATATSPRGTATANHLVEDSATSVHAISQTKSITAGQTITYSQWVKASSGSRFIRLQFSSDASANGCRWLFNPDTGATALAATAFGTGTLVGAPSIESWPNGWYRISLTGTVDAAATSVTFGAFLQNQSATYGASYAGNGTFGVYAFGAQGVAAAAMSSYIPTVAAAVTRAADVAFISDIAAWYGATEGALFVEWTPGQLGAAGRLFQVGSSNTNTLLTIQSATSTAQFQVTDTGVTQANLSTGGALAVGTRARMIGAYKVNDFAKATDGGSLQTDVSGTVPTGANAAYIGSSFTGTQFLNGCIGRITAYSVRPSNETSVALTA